ncbi:hypothetical protein GH714_030162 [Hevea brasiliensis]|uniref:Transcription initiation factor TFIID subunit 12 domain-containing protein n=1 Tax=Hevea brasiliensis TaxID=3981 RepID=A0A6A6M1P3_HEVBR|nr:hypothetical protein GH714_030162 [Hevea brasiliensis]
MNWWRSHATLRTLFLLFLGVDAPITQSIFNYFALALVYGSILLYKRQKIQLSWYWYLLLGFVDVQGNYLVNKAYQYSSLTSVTLLDCFTVAWAIVLTWFFLGTRYSIWQLFGAAICVLGLGLVLLSDAGVGGEGGSKPLLGDSLVIAGTLFFAFSNVGEEFCVKNKNRVEVVSMLGLYGMLVVSFVLALGSFSSSLIANLGVQVPITQCSFTYFFLALVYGSILLHRRQKLLVHECDNLVLGSAGSLVLVSTAGFHRCSRKLFLMGHNSPWLSFNTQNSLSQLSGAGLCLLGLVLVFFSDAGGIHDHIYTFQVDQDLFWVILVIAATFFYALGNTGELSGATMFNLSLLSSDMWAVIVRIFLYHQQARQGMQGVQGMGMVGSVSSGSQIRPGGISGHHQQRPVQSSIRPSSSSPNNQSPATQNFQGHGFMRPSSVGPPTSPAPSASQSMQSPSQPWLSSGSQGKPPLPSPSYRPQINAPSLQQRSHIPQQHHSLPTTSQQQHMSSAQPQQPLPSHQPSDHYGQQFPPSRVPRSITQQLGLQGSANPKPPSLPMVQPNTVQPGTQNRTANAESEESGNRILSKRSINELVSQIDPFEKLDPEVEDILADIADEFVDSITTFGCSLAKHRKSDTLEAKDILLHLERNWNMTLPGFSGDEIKTYRKPLTSDIHKERLAAIKKSILATEMTNAKSSVGQAAGNAKSNLSKTPANAMVSPNVKIREVT